MAENSLTTYRDKVSILSSLWMNFRYDEEFEDFVEYNDIGLPLAYAIDNEIVESTEIASRFIEETFDLLLAGLELEDEGFETLDDLLGTA